MDLFHRKMGTAKWGSRSFWNLGHVDGAVLITVRAVVAVRETDEDCDCASGGAILLDADGWCTSVF